MFKTNFKQKSKLVFGCGLIATLFHFHSFVWPALMVKTFTGKQLLCWNSHTLLNIIALQPGGNLSKMEQRCYWHIVIVFIKMFAKTLQYVFILKQKNFFVNKILTNRKRIIHLKVGRLLILRWFFKSVIYLVLLKNYNCIFV